MKTQILKSVIATSVLTVLTVISSSAYANNVTATVTGFAYANPQTATITSATPAVNNLAVYAGGFSGTYADSTSFIAYCADISQELAPWNSVQTYTQGNLASAFSSTKAADLTTLGNKYYSLVNNAETSAAFQIATWEILYENTLNPYQVNSNSFKAFGGTGVSLAQTWLSGLHDSSFAVTGNYSIGLLQSGKYQDVVTVTPVPEPETYAMMLAGLGLMGFVARRRKS